MDLVVKKCAKCQQEKPVSDFCRDKKRPDGFVSRCKPCRNEGQREWRARNPEKTNAMARAWRDKNPERAKSNRRAWDAKNPQRVKASRIKKFGITPEEYNVLFESQGGRCATCDRHRSELTKDLAVDHDHRTGRVRGLLCFRCNVGLGYFCDSSKTLLKAAAYLNAAEL